MIMLLVFLCIMLYIEKRYNPRIDVTCEGDVFLWYNSYHWNKPSHKTFIRRKNKFLFHIK